MDAKVIEMLEEYAADRIVSIATNMLSDGMPVSLVAKYTELPEEEIQKIRDEVKPPLSDAEISMMRAEAYRDGASNLIYNMVENRVITEQMGAQYLGISPEKLRKRMMMLSDHMQQF